MTRRYLKLAIAGSLFTLTACAQQSEIRQMHQSVDALAGLPLLHGVHTVQSEGVLVGNVLLDEEHQRGDDDSDDGDSGCKAPPAAPPPGRGRPPV